jgi:hypothetical protein
MQVRIRVPLHSFESVIKDGQQCTNQDFGISRSGVLEPLSRIFFGCVLALQPRRGYETRV